MRETTLQHEEQFLLSDNAEKCKLDSSDGVVCLGSGRTEARRALAGLNDKHSDSEGCQDQGGKLYSNSSY